MINYLYRVLITVSLIVSGSMELKADDLYIGKASIDITPKIPVALLGQFHLRLATSIETPLTANIIALESKSGGTSLGGTVFVSCDLTVITDRLIDRVRQEVKNQQLKGLDENRVILTATHTHTAPVFGNENLVYPIPKEGVTQIEEYFELLVERISGGVVQAWNNRQRGSVSWGQGHAVVGYNRRSSYEDGSASMYGGTHVPSFTGIEGYEDHDINTLFFWNARGKLIATSISVACPAQEVENREAVNADYWHEVRKRLHKRYGKDLVVVGWIAASGDQSPRPMYRSKSEQRMRDIAGRNQLEEIAYRIVNAVDEIHNVIKKERQNDVLLSHKTETLQLPMRMLSEKEYEEAKEGRDRLMKEMSGGPEKVKELQAWMMWYRDAALRYENQRTSPNQTVKAEIHVIRIGDIVICTNPFELFTEYGIRIQGRSKALQTFVVQLAGAKNYLPTAKAIEGGGYSVIMQSSFVGAEGGKILTDTTVEMINKMFDEGNK